jgi:hypothetical protein
MMNQPARIILAISVGIISALAGYVNLANRGESAADFSFSWRAARLLLTGENPYQAIQPGEDYPFQTYFYYPLTSALAAVPFAPLPPYLAGAAFVGLSSTLLAYAISRDSLRRLPMLLSAPYVVAVAVAQWSPLLVAAALTPWLEWLLTCKPNVGLVGFAYKPSWRGLLAMIVFAGLALILLPSWPIEWLQVMRSLEGHPPPMLILPLGPLLLLSVLRWRKPEGRLLLVSAILPQFLFFYDQLPLWLIPRSLPASLVYTGLSWVAYFAWRSRELDQLTGEILRQPSQYILALIYLPALLLVLWPRGEEALAGRVASLVRCIRGR